MFGIDDAIIAAVAPSVIGGVADIFGGQQTNQTSMDLANQANAFSANQFATRYQTTVQDLTKAGLNPMLAYGQGGGSPPSAVGIAQQTNPLQRAGEMASKAVGTQLTNAQITEAISRVGVNDEQRRNLDADTKLKILEAPNVSQRTKNLVSEQLLNDARTTATHAQEAATRLDTSIRQTGDVPEAKRKGDYYENAPYNPYYLKDAAQGVNTAVNAKSLIGK
jgi:hypothetical protein